MSIMHHYWILILTLLFVTQIVIYFANDAMPSDDNGTNALQSASKDVSVSLTWDEITNLMIHAITAFKTLSGVFAANQFTGSDIEHRELANPQVARPLLPAATEYPIAATQRKGFDQITMHVSPYKTQADRMAEIKAKKEINTYSVPTNVNVVTDSNKDLLPPFEESGFEFWSLSQSKFLQNGEFSRSDFQEMMTQLHDESQKIGETYEHGTAHQEPIVGAAVREFGERHGMRLTAIRSQIIMVSILGTPAHFDDNVFGDTRTMRLWIPVTRSKKRIDNWLLAVGNMNGQQYDPKNGTFSVDGMQYFQMDVMSNEDWIFFHDSPHFSANQGDSRSTQQRFALAVTCKIERL